MQFHRAFSYGIRLKGREKRITCAMVVLGQGSGNYQRLLLMTQLSKVDPSHEEKKVCCVDQIQVSTIEWSRSWLPEFVVKGS